MRAEIVSRFPEVTVRRRRQVAVRIDLARDLHPRRTPLRLPQNFFKWSLASIVFATDVADWRPNDKLRPNGQCQPQVLPATQRRIDGSGSGGFHG
jgi:hypothetical protein